VGTFDHSGSGDFPVWRALLAPAHRITQPSRKRASRPNGAVISYLAGSSRSLTPPEVEQCSQLIIPSPAMRSDHECLNPNPVRCQTQIRVIPGGAPTQSLCQCQTRRPGRSRYGPLPPSPDPHRRAAEPKSGTLGANFPLLIPLCMCHPGAASTLAVSTCHGRGFAFEAPVSALPPCWAQKLEIGSRSPPPPYGALPAIPAT
jgi:hypothetical protein